MRKSVHIVTDAAQHSALASPIRLEVLEHLGDIGPTSVRDLAKRMDRSPHALHYHMRCLTEVGLVVQAGTRKSGSRDEAVFDVIADLIEVDFESDGSFNAELKAVRAILRRAERDFTAQAAVNPERLGGNDGYAGRLRGRLSRSARDDVMRHLRAIQRIFTEERRDHPPQARVETYTMTTVFLPEA